MDETKAGQEAGAAATPEENGYPTEADLARIRAWRWTDCRGLLEFVRALWHWPDWGWGVSHDQVEYIISTGGWSGNEDLIDAMRDNRMVWTMCWWSSRRGGHFVFRVPATERPARPAPPEPLAPPTPRSDK